MSNVNLVYGLPLHEFSVDQWIERPQGVWEVIDSNPDGDSDFFFVPLSLHADYFIFTFVCSPSLKFIIFHSFTNLAESHTKCNVLVLCKKMAASYFVNKCSINHIMTEGEVAYWQ